MTPPSTRREDALVGAVEAGGTKIVCAVGSGPRDRLLARASLPTSGDPAALLAEVAAWLHEQSSRLGDLRAIGIACFGPVDLSHGSPTFGHITSTPKPGWKGIDVAGAFRRAFPGLPIGFDTDVNGAALGEHCWGHGLGLDDFVYITIGTGIGAGAMVGGQLVHGLVHPEMGHMLLPRVIGDTFAGVCPYHGACWEGLCSGPALRARTGQSAEEIAPDHEAWALETHHIAQAIANITCVLSPRRVILGGSVRKAGRLGEERFFGLLREKVRAALRDYIDSPAMRDQIDGYIVPPLLGDDAGVCGAIALGQRAVT